MAADSTGIPFQNAFERATGDDHPTFVGYRAGDMSTPVGAIAWAHWKGRKISVAAYDEWGQVEYRQHFDPQHLAAANAFGNKRYLIDDVEWFERGA